MSRFINNKHIEYLKRLLKHKYFVFVAGIKVGVPPFQLLIHDLSKLSLSEYNFWLNRLVNPDINIYDYGWINHYHKNKHHWQFWVLREDSGVTRCLEMPDKYIKEMVADWMGAQKNKIGNWDTKEWYYKRKDTILLHPNTRIKVEKIINELSM